MHIWCLDTQIKHIQKSEDENTTEIKAMTKTIEKLVDRVTDLESKMSDLRHNDLESVTEMNK